MGFKLGSDMTQGNRDGKGIPGEGTEYEDVKRCERVIAFSRFRMIRI